MSITNVRATQIGAHAFRYLSGASRVGIVISTFQHGFNVLFDEGTASAFVTLQNHNVPLHPWAIETCELASTQQVGANARKESKRPQLRIGEVVVVLSQATVHPLRIKPWTEDEIARVQDRIPVIKELLAKEFAQRPRDPFHLEINATLKRWRLSGCAGDLLGLIGLGTGSTPSGDDLIIGMLAAFVALGRTTLATLLQTTEIQQRTHSASAQMIEAAMDNAFPHLLLDLANQLSQETSTREQIQQSIEAVASQGATSGVAMLRGFNATLIAHLRQNK